MTHTPGPWKSTFGINGKRGVRAEGGFICFLPKPSRYTGQDERYERELEESKANARLLAAAPDLLAALEVFFKVVVVDGKQYRPGYPLCAGCDELTVARGMECYYKRETTECKYPDELLKASALADAESK